MKTTLGIVVGVVVGIIIVVGVSTWIISTIISSKNEPTLLYTTNVPSYSAAPSPAPPYSAPSTSVPATVQLSPSPVVTASPVQSDVNFSLNVASFQVSGLTSGTVKAQITNTGSSDAHNVWAKVEIIYQGSTIKIGGQDYLRVELGTIGAGQTTSPQITISVNIIDGVKISQNGATLKLTIYSDEKTQTMSYDYHP